jgi:Polysaccharide lyase
MVTVEERTLRSLFHLPRKDNKQISDGALSRSRENRRVLDPSANGPAQMQSPLIYSSVANSRAYSPPRRSGAFSLASSFAILLLAGCGRAAGEGADAGSPGLPASNAVTSAASAPSAVAVIGSVTAAAPMAQLAGRVQLLGTYPLLNSVKEAGINGNGTVLGSPLRYGKVRDPTGANRQVFRHALRYDDPDTAGAVKRVDIEVPNGKIAKDTVYWSAMEVYIPSNTYTAMDNSTIAAIHIGANCCSGNWELQLNKSVFQIAKTWDSGAGEQTKWFTPPQPPADRWLKIIVQWKANAVGANGAFINVWINGDQVLADTGPNTVPGPGDYAKFGYYNFTLNANGGGDQSRPQREIFWRSYYLVKDNGYTLEQVAALLR